MNITENLNLNKPDLDDVVDIDVLNENMDILDSKINEIDKNTCELLAEYVLDVNTNILLKPITEEMFYKYKSFFFRCENNDEMLIATYFGTILLDHIQTHSVLNTQSLQRSYNNNIFIRGSSLTYTNNVTATPVNATRNVDYKIELYGVKYA